MGRYLIEFRFFGKAKKEIKSLIWDINKRHHIRPRHRPVPHVSLAGPFPTRYERKLVNDFKNICEKQDVMQFHTVGYNTFEDNRVVYIEIKPDKNLDDFRWELSQTLQPYCKLRTHDLKKEFIFHATLAMKLHPKKFEQVKKYISKKPKLKFRNVLLRVTLIKNRKILQEYDFLLKKMLKRREAKSSKILSRTFYKLKKYLGISEPILEIDFGFFYKFKNLFEKRNIFLISDTHFDHTNIIEYCNRPFRSVSEMNEAMLNNWNKTVGKKDIVFFLGDMRFGKGSRETDYWLKKLNGIIYFINNKDNPTHDTKSKITKYYNMLFIRYRNKKFLLVHDPIDVPKYWDGWTICGHKHNNNLRDFPLINGKNKTINVSVELINYTPLSMEKLFKLDFEKIGYMEKIEKTF